jgi:hypothetical protein
MVFAQGNRMKDIVKAYKQADEGFAFADKNRSLHFHKMQESVLPLLILDNRSRNFMCGPQIFEYAFAVPKTLGLI